MAPLRADARSADDWCMVDWGDPKSAHRTSGARNRASAIDSLRDIATVVNV